MSTNTESAVPLRAFCPEHLSLEGIPEKWADYARWVIGHLYVMRHVKSQSNKPDSYFPLSSAVLKKLFPKRDYRKILNSVVEMGIVEENSSYRAKHFSKGFRLTDKYREQKFRSVPLDNAKFVKKLREYKCSTWQHSSPHHHLNEMAKRLEVAPDHPSSLVLAMIAERQSRFSVCSQGRVHTLLTNMESELRPYLRMDGEVLHQIDIVNSQPLILGLTLNGKRVLNSDEFREYMQWLQTNHANQAIEPYQVSYVGTSGDDLSIYLDLCQQGIIYERLSELSGYSRDDVKGHFFAVAYGHPSHGDTIVGRAFQNEFPSCWDALAELKQHDYRTVARLMQTIESYVVIWRVCGRIHRELPEAPLLTVHDSLVTTEPYLKDFERILLDEFRLVFDVVPRMKVSAFEAEAKTSEFQPEHYLEKFDGLSDGLETSSLLI